MSIDNEGELAWITKQRIIEEITPTSDLQPPTFPLPLWEGDKIFLRLLLDESTPFFSLKLVYEQDEMVSAALNGKALCKENTDKF